MIRVWWSQAPKPGNLGDVLTPVILRGLGYEVRHAPRRKADLFAIGSIVRFVRRGQTVWGSGAMWRHDRPAPDARYLAVRGPLTRDVVRAVGGECPEVYGDPALLLPKVHDRPVEKRHDVGLVPHYIDRADPQVTGSDLPTIDPLRADPLEVVDEIRACHAILSSSLHGLIVAHAYGIPAAWVRFGDRLDGDDVKFADYGHAVGVTMRPYETIEAARPVLPRPFDTDPLEEALRSWT